MRTHPVSTRIFHPNWHTLVYFLKDGQVLLGQKKRGLGVGRFNGFGGKPFANETATQTAIREAQEEVGVIPLTLTHVGNLQFRSKVYKPLRDLYVYVFFSRSFRGAPRETEEMAPQWFPILKIPYKKMWPDDPEWLPHALGGNFVAGEFWFDDKERMLKHTVHQWDIMKPLKGKRA